MLDVVLIARVYIALSEKFSPSDVKCMMDACVRADVLRADAD